MEIRGWRDEHKITQVAIGLRECHDPIVLAAPIIAGRVVTFHAPATNAVRLDLPLRTGDKSRIVAANFCHQRIEGGRNVRALLGLVAIYEHSVDNVTRATVS